MRAKLLGGVVSSIIFFGVPLFAVAGTLDWPRAWIFVAAVTALSAWTMFGVLAHDPALLDERYGAPIQRDQPLADKIITPLIALGFLAFVLFIPRDVVHYRMLGSPPLGLALVGFALFVAGWLLITAALRANAFAAPIVKHPEGQRVIDQGPYRIIRHPMYAAALLMFVGMPLWLGSYAGIIAAALPMLPIVARIVVEERTLRRDLLGYADYAARVRWRMIPGLW
jgi:protein-S-isoprenylcysteine O-methyltransferase Ste14